MDQKFIEEMKRLSREERMAYFNEHKAELMEDVLSAVNGGAASQRPNADSEVPYGGNYWTSLGFVCGDHIAC